MNPLFKSQRTVSLQFLPKLIQVEVEGVDTHEASSGWTKADTIALVTCVLAVPPAIAAGIALLRSRRALHTSNRGEYFFL